MNNKTIYFNKQQIDRLKDAVPHFTTVVKAQWKRGTTRQLNDLIADVYKEATGKDINRNWSCATCCYNAYLTVGRMYFDSLDNLNTVQVELEPIVIINELQDDVANSETNNKPKRGRPKKFKD